MRSERVRCALARRRTSEQTRLDERAPLYAAITTRTTESATDGRTKKSSSGASTASPRARASSARCTSGSAARSRAERAVTKVKSREQAIAIGLSEAREAGAKVPRKRRARRRRCEKTAPRRALGAEEVEQPRRSRAARKKSTPGSGAADASERLAGRQRPGGAQCTSLLAPIPLTGAPSPPPAGSTPAPDTSSTSAARRCRCACRTARAAG